MTAPDYDPLLVPPMSDEELAEIRQRILDGARAYQQMGQQLPWPIHLQLSLDIPHLVEEVERQRAEAKRQQQWKADVLREAAHEIESRYPETVWLPDSDSPDAMAAKGVRVACKQLRHMADEIDAEAAAKETGR